MIVRSSTTTFPSQPLPSLTALATVRDAFVGWLRELRVEAEQIDELAVVVSELGANAVRETPHGTPEATVSARLDGSHLEVHVTNAVGEGTSSVRNHSWDLDDALRTGGRGLLLVSAFVDDVEVEAENQRLVVRCTVGLRFEAD